ncbi:hypothetical protein, partial [Streptomyces viridochromogenes]|uniref:hypothetical protein n=1 Tax=Streptomyces viridochromogenes TaxID=1938 RepID=UPI0030B8EA89
MVATSTGRPSSPATRSARSGCPRTPSSASGNWNAATGVDVTRLGLAPAEHPLLGAAVTVAGAGQTLFTSRISAHTHSWLTDSTVHGAAVLPPSALAELAVRAG